MGDPSGPSGIFTRGRTLYIAIGVGDVGIGGPFPGTTLENPNGPSSPIFSSILAIQFSVATEKTTNGFTLTLADDQALANGETVTLSNSGPILWPMPNHLLSDILKSWKQFSSRKAKKIVGLGEEPFWQPESYDHWIRSDEEKARIARYIQNNPVTSGLCVRPEDWRWSSAWRASS